jgi:hypothetical protein
MLEARWWLTFIVVFVSVTLIIGGKTAKAGSPFLTDDPGFAPEGWEIKPIIVFECNKSQSILTAPIIDINYAIVKNFKLNLTLGIKTIYPDGGRSHTGMNDTDFKFKWRFLDEETDKLWPAISIAPTITFPTAPTSNGLGDGIWRAKIPFQFGKTFGNFYTYSELGYQWVFDDSASDQLLYGYVVQYQFTDKFTLGIEFANGSMPFESKKDYSLVGNIGASYTFNENWQLQGSIGRTLRDVDLGGPEFLGQIFVQWNFK